MRQPRSHVALDLALPAGAALCCAAGVAMLPGASPLRAAAGLALVLVLPGLALGRTLFPRPIGTWERLLVVLSGSVILGVLLALALAAASVTLRTSTWTWALAGVTGIGLVVGAVRNGPVHATAAPRWRVRRRDVLALVGALVLAAGALTLGMTPLHAPPDTLGHTALWLVAPPGAPGTVELGITGGDLKPTTYRLQLTANGRPMGAPTRLTVAPGEHITRRLAVPVSGGGTRVRARLSPVSGDAGQVRTNDLVVPLP